MNKKLLIILLIVLTFGIAASYFSSPKASEVQADEANGYRVEQVFSDKFNKEDLDSSWTLNDATLELNYCGLHCKSPVSYGSGPVLNAATLSNKTQINFTIYPISGEGNSNITFIIGCPSPSSPLKEPEVDCKVMLWNDQVVFCDWQHNLEVNQDKIDKHVLRGFSGLYSDLKRTDVSIIIERKTETLTEIYVEYSRDGEVVYSMKDQAFELSDPRYYDKYCGFFWDVVEMDITNFEIFNDDKLVYEDDLTTNTLTYDATDYTLGKIHINSTLNESQVYVSRVSSVKFDNANESIVNSNVLTKIENVSTPYNLTYSMKVNELKANSFYGFGFGLKDGDTKVDAKNAVGFIKKDAQTAEVVAVRNGVVDRSNSYQISLAKLGNGRYINYDIKLDYSNNVYLTVAGATYKFSNIDIYGKAGIGLVNLGATESSSVELNSFSLSRNVCKVYSSEDVSNNFKGVTEVDENDPYSLPEPYINDQKYYIGSKVSVEEDWTTGETRVNFSDSNAYSGFAYTKPYTEWMLEFDIELFSRGQGQMFGVAFGRTSYVDVLIQASASSNAYLIRCDGGSSSQITYGANVTFSDGTTSQLCSLNPFSAQQSKYHFLLVAKNRTVYVYYKAIDAPTEDLGILRATISDVNIDGYVAFVGNNHANFGITNFKLVNLSDTNTTESELTLRENFEDATKLSNKVTLLENSKVENGKLVLNDSAIKTAKQKTYEIIRFTTEEIKDNLEINFSTNKKIVFDSKNNKIVIYEGEQSTEFDCSEINLKNVKGKRFEVGIYNGKVQISYKGFYDPSDKLNDTFISYTLTSPLSADYITIKANGAAKLDDLYLFSLDNTETCATYNYVDDPNTAETWVAKEDYDKSKVYSGPKMITEVIVEEVDGCESSATVSTLVVLVLGLMPVLVVRKKEEK